MYMDDYLSDNEIANACSKLLSKEYKKIDRSLKTFGELAVLFDTCEKKTNNEWNENCENLINEVIKTNIAKKYFNISMEDAKEELRRKFPINKNKNKKREYKLKNI